MSINRLFLSIDIYCYTAQKFTTAHELSYVVKMSLAKTDYKDQPVLPYIPNTRFH